MIKFPRPFAADPKFAEGEIAQCIPECIERLLQYFFSVRDE